jgi:hypothetical protein
MPSLKERIIDALLSRNLVTADQLDEQARVAEQAFTTASAKVDEAFARAGSSVAAPKSP